MCVRTSGDERTTWSDDDDTDTEEPNNQSEPSEPHPLITSVSSPDGYGSGDLGDMSHASVTDVPDNDSDSDSDVPRRNFMERYALTSDQGLSDLLDQVTIPDKPDSVPSLIPVTKDEPDYQGQSEEGEGGKGDKQVPEESSSSSVLAPPSDELVAKIMERMWRYCHAYQINNSVREQ